MSSASLVQTNTTYGVVCPILAALNASANKKVQYEIVDKEEVTIADISEFFTVALPDASAVSILNAFSVRDPDSLNGSDPSANVEVGFTSSDEFKNAITFALQNAVDASEQDISSWLYSESGGNVNARLNTYISEMFSKDNFPNILASFATQPATMTVNHAAGSSDLATKLVADDGELRRYFVTQLPTQNVSAYQLDADGSDNVIDLGFLPLLKGDKITFVWNATIELSSTKEDHVRVDVTSTVPDNVSAVADTRVFAMPEYVNLTQSTHRIAVTITLGTALEEGNNKFTVADGKLTA
jgi:hypothetical protein